MSKVLRLKERSISGNPRAWSDGIVLQNACTMLQVGKPPQKALVWGIIASKIELAMEAATDSQPVEVKLTNQEAVVLWKALMNNVTNEMYGRNLRTGEPAPVSAGTLYQMLGDIAGQLGAEMPQADEGEE